MPPTDRRIRRTKKALEKALITLTLDKGYDAITIQDITEQADIGYRTFFRHYADKDALLRDVLASTVADIRQLMELPPPEVFANPDLEISSITNFKVLFEHVKANISLYRVFLRSEPSIMESVQRVASNEIRDIFQDVTFFDIPFDIVANHIVAAIFAQVRWWVDHDMPHSPAQMAEYSEQLILKPIRDRLLHSLPKTS